MRPLARRKIGTKLDRRSPFVSCADANMRRRAVRNRIAFEIAGLAAVLLTAAIPAAAQDVPGIELCTSESRLDRRTGCLQSNVEFLQQVIAKSALDAQQKLNAANRDIAALKEQL